MGEVRRKGRPKAIPESSFVMALRLRLGGLGYETIAQELRRSGLDVSRGSVWRFLHARPPYDDPVSLGIPPDDSGPCDCH